ncbi:MAG: hypothetical protein OHK0022_22110 [Roseiflexaceae bacterium]
MRDSSNNQSGVIIAAIIGAIATVLAALISRGQGFDQGFERGRVEVLTSVPQQPKVVTQIVEVTRPVEQSSGQEVAVVEVTQIVDVTRIVEVTPVPTNLPPTPEMTPPGTVLEEGQAWRGNGFEITMKIGDFKPGYYKLYFYVRSRKKENLAIRYNISNAYAVDNQGDQLKVSKSHCTEVSVNIRPNEEQLLHCSYDIAEIWVYGDMADSNLKEIIVTLPAVLGIENAQWRIVVPH